MYFYYINTNEIPAELSHKNMISSQSRENNIVKITCYYNIARKFA